MSVMIIADSACGLTQAEARELDVRLLPLTVVFGRQQYLDGVTLTDAEFYRLLAQGPDLPTTGQVTPFQYQEVLRQLGGQDEAVILTLSGKASGTVQSARIAAEEYGERVRVVDTNNLTLGQRVLVEYAVQLRSQGLSAAEIARKVLADRDKAYVMGVVDTLDYLKRGGRISKSVAFAGGLLNIKPVLCVRDGEVSMLGKARGLSQSNNLLNQTVEKIGGIDFSKPFAVGYTGSDDTAAKSYLQQSTALWQHAVKDIPLRRLGSAIGTHVGPGAVAVAFFGRFENAL